MANHKLRSVNTRFWEDPFIEELSPSEKLLFLYLLTNPLCNILGIYEISEKRISYDTGISKETIIKALKGFEKLEKVFYINNYIVLSNFLKNQKLNDNMFTGAVKLFNDLPNEVKTIVLIKGLKGFERVLKASENFEKYEIEIEVESEDEIKEEHEIDFNIFWNKYHETTGKEKTDKSDTEKHWNKLKKPEKQKAIDNIENYFNSLNDIKYCKKARTYISSKNFNDEFNPAPSKKQTPKEKQYKVKIEGLAEFICGEREMKLETDNAGDLVQYVKPIE